MLTKCGECKRLIAEREAIAGLVREGFEVTGFVDWKYRASLHEETTGHVIEDKAP